MKIRIQGNSLRLRLSQSELDQFAAEGRVADEINFGPDESEMLTYELIRTGAQRAITAEFSGAEISVYIPEELSKTWTGTSQVGMKATQAAGKEMLQILIEKDFQCLHKRADEDESDMYPNPDSKKMSEEDIQR